MTVYVDNAEHKFGRMIMCHMWADTRAELFAMADAIGVARKWFQRPDSVGGDGMSASWEHFDIAKTKRAEAIAAGAVAVCQFTMCEHAERQKFIAAVDAQHWRRAEGALYMMCLAAETRARREQ